MSAPASNFTYNNQGLSITFVDRSSGNPTAWSWNFGDSTELSTVRNPSHTYSVPGVYFVSLSVSNEDGSSEKGFNIVVSEVATLSQSIWDMVQQFLVGTSIEFDGQRFTTLKEYWQLYLAPNMDPEIVNPDIFDESKWPGLANMLIAKLIVFELAWGSTGGSLISTGTLVSGGSGALKRMETGPSNAEWFDPSETVKSMFGGTGSNAYSIFLDGICLLARNLNLRLPFCDNPNEPVLFRIANMGGGCGCIPPVASKGGWPWRN